MNSKYIHYKMLRRHEHGLPAQIRQPTLNWNDMQYAANMAGHVADYTMGRGDFAPIKRSSAELMEADSSSNKNPRNDGDNTSTSMDVATMSNSANGSGYRGKFTGNTAQNKSYEKYYHEIIELHSRKVRSKTLLWGFSHFVKPDTNNLRFNIEKLGSLTGPVPQVSRPGLVQLTTLSVWKYTNPFTPYGADTGITPNFDISDYIYSAAFNPKFGDFLDNKVFADSGNKGIATQYNKFRLKSFTVSFSFNTFEGGLSHEAPWVLFGGNANSGIGANSEFKSAHNNHNVNRLPISYWVFRDALGSYANSDSDIPIVPPQSLYDQQAEDKAKREAYAIRNFDRNLTVLNEAEEFSFTREVNPVGNSYMDRALMLALKNVNIAKVVNLLEGQAETAVSKPLTEFFNFLICPINPPVKWHGEYPKGDSNTFIYIPIVQITTKMYVKYTAKWEGFDYDYYYTDFPNPGGREITTETRKEFFIEPLKLAEIDYKNQQLVECGQLNQKIIGK